MLVHAAAILSLGALCGAWIVVQRFVERRMPGAPGVGRRCGDCPGGGACAHRRECPREVPACSEP
jgi:hypothetical protein